MNEPQNLGALRDQFPAALENSNLLTGIYRTCSDRALVECRKMMAGNNMRRASNRIIWTQ